MAEETNDVVYAGFWRRVGAGLFDAIIAMAISWPITMPMMKWQLANKSIILSLVFSVVFTAVIVYIVSKYGGTPGKLIMNVRIVDSNFSYIKWPRALLRMVFPGLLMNVNSILQLISINQNIPNEAISVSSMIEIGQLMKDYGQPFSSAATFLAFLMYADIGVILFNKKKKAIHDYIADTMVITNSSYFQMHIDKEEKKLG